MIEIEFYGFQKKSMEPYGNITNIEMLHTFIFKFIKESFLRYFVVLWPYLQEGMFFWPLQKTSKHVNKT